MMGVQNAVTVASPGFTGLTICSANIPDKVASEWTRNGRWQFADWTGPPQSGGSNPDLGTTAATKLRGNRGWVSTRVQDVLTTSL